MIQRRTRAGVEPQEAAPPLALPEPMLDACRGVAIDLGGPKLTRIGVTSALRGEGRTSLALAMAAGQEADFERRVVVVDLDLESAGLAREAGVRPWPGLSELARQEASIDEVLQPVGELVSVVSAGVTEGNAPRMLGEVLRQGLIDQLAERADLVVADLPPILSCSFGRAAVEPFPQLLMVVRGGVTPVVRIREAVRLLPSEPRVVLNATSTALPRWLRRLLAH